MIAVYLNLILLSLAVLSLVAGVSFFTQKSGFRHVRVFTLLFGIASAMVCGGYSIMGFMVNENWAFIPRLVGYFGIDTFLILEIEYVLFDMSKKTNVRYVPLGCLIVYEVFDMIVCGRPHALNYTRNAYYTFYQNSNPSIHLFHYSFILTTAVTLITIALLWYKQKTIKREKYFVITISFSHTFVFIASVLDFLNAKPIYNLRTFSFCAGIAFVFFVWFFSNRKYSKFIPSVENVSKEVFFTIDVPIVIFDLEGTIKVCNPAASNKFHTTELNADENKITLRNYFTFSDVATMHLLSRSKNAMSGRYQTTIKTTGEPCFLTCFVKLDYTGDPFCVIGTISTSPGGNE
ncbi:MAG: hypothetical protein K6C98_10150 [Treponema sp.]|nr:hypothetical protein [Treponema sp.]